MDNDLYVFKEDGTLKWIFPCQAGIHSALVPYRNYVFFSSDDDRVYAVNQTNGEPAWSFKPRFTVYGVMNYATTPDCC
jgi:outer membrane protein assembly factor BamB